MDDAGGSQRQGQIVFLSYASLDRDAARPVATGLRSSGVDVWWDEGGIGWGDNWQGKLEEALSRCGAYLILARGRYDRDGMDPHRPTPRRAAPGGPGRGIGAGARQHQQAGPNDPLPATGGPAPNRR